MSDIIASHDIEAADTARISELEAEVERLRARNLQLERDAIDPLYHAALNDRQRLSEEKAKLEAENAERRARIEGIRGALTEHQRAIVQQHLNALDDPKPSEGT